MKIKRFILIVLFLLSFTVLAGAKLDFLSWQKEEISETQIAYKNPEEKISLYIGKLEDPTEWDADNIEEEILEMQKSRAEIVSFFGMKDYHIGQFDFDESDEQFSILALSGSYIDVSDDTIYFKEINLRYGHLGAQIKINGSDYDKIQSFDLSEAINNEKAKLVAQLRIYEENENH